MYCYSDLKFDDFYFDLFIIYFIIATTFSGFLFYSSIKFIFDSAGPLVGLFALIGAVSVHLLIPLVPKNKTKSKK